MRRLREPLDSLIKTSKEISHKVKDGATNLTDKTKNLIVGTRLDQKARKQFEQLVEEHGVKKLLGAGLLAGGGATGAVMLGKALLSDDEVASIAITPDGNLIVEETEPKESNVSLNLLGAAALAGAGTLALGADYGAPSVYGMDDDLVRTGYSSDPYASATPHTDAVLDREAQLVKRNKVADEIRLRAGRSRGRI